ncbi:thioredoxin [Alphaproteobacteria bacterium]|nr:thioredoxin [Alphaproteobacteria bacterium]
MEQLIAAAADTTPIDVNMDNFMAEVIDGSAKMPIVVQFWAPWCGPCKQLGPLLEKVVAAAKGKVKMVRINIDENQQIAQQMRVQSVPTVYGFFNGQPVDGFAGAQPESTLKKFIDKLVAAGGSGPNIVAMVEAANSLLETQDYDNAMTQYHEIMAADPESPDGLAGMIRCMVGMKDIDGAREIVDQLDDEFRDKSAMVIAIDSLELAEKVAGAAGGLAQARAAVDADPNDLAARQELALALFATGEQAESMEQLLESIRIDRAWNDAAARMQLLEFFKTLGPANRDVMAARRKLSTLLFA